MTTAPERATERAEDGDEVRTRTERRVKAQGHLSLVDWTAAVPEEAPKTLAPKRAAPARRAAAERIYEWGVLLLMAASACAAIASFAHL